MLIKVTTKLFKIEPDLRFSYEHNVPKGFWNDLWRRHKMLEYTVKELCDFYTLKTGKQASWSTIDRWLLKTEIFNKARPYVKKGVNVINTDIFGELEEKVINELTRQIRESGISNSNVII